MKKNVENMLEEAYNQMSDDRKKILESYEKFSSQVETLNDYAVNGQNLNKCLELMTKQTAQFIDLVKLQDNRSKAQGVSLDDDDEKEEVYKQMKNYQNAMQ